MVDSGELPEETLKRSRGPRQTRTGGPSVRAVSTWTPLDAPTAEPEREQHTPEPEPVNVGPVAGGSLRASDADRDQVSSLLSAAYAEGRLTREEHDERVEQVMVARTFDDLIPLTADLVPLDPTPTTVSSPTREFVVGNGQLTETDRMAAVFGGVERRGHWRVRRSSQVTAVFGGVDLDLRQADFDAPVVELNVQTCFGGIDIKVPAGITVRDETTHVFGGVDIKNLGEPVEGAPTLVLKGTVFFGGIEVKGPKARWWNRGTARPGLAALDPRPHRMHHRMRDLADRVEDRTSRRGR